MSQKGSQKWRHYREKFLYKKASVADLDNLFQSERFKVGNGPNKESELFENALEGLKKMEENTEFCIDKWKTFIKFSLLTQTNIEQMLRPHVSDEERLNTYCTYFMQEVQTIKEEMLKSENFRTIFLGHSNHILEDINKELEEYNQEFKKNNPNRQILINKDEFQKIYNRVLSKLAITKKRG